MVTDGSSVNFLFIVYLLKYVMILTREEKERLVLDLYNEGKSTREIAQIAHMSFRDIGAIIEKKRRSRKQKKDKHDRAFCLHKHTNYSLKVNLRYK